MTKVLIVGTGFIGSRFIELYRNDYDIAAISRFPCARFPAIPQYVVDPQMQVSQQYLAGVDVIIHTAHDALIFNNIRLLRALYQGGEAAGVRKVVYLGSLSKYAFVDGPINEASGEQTVNEAYARAKVKLDKEVRCLSRSHQIATDILNPTLVLGAGGSWNDYALRALRGGAIELPGNGQGLANIIFVDDVCRAIERAVKYKSDTLTEDYIISSGLTPTWPAFYGMYQSVLKSLGEGCGEILLSPDTSPYSPSKHKNLLYRVLYSRLGARLFEAFQALKYKPPSQKASRPANPNVKFTNAVTRPKGIYRKLHVHTLSADISKARAKLGFQPEYDSLEAIEAAILKGLQAT